MSDSTQEALNQRYELACGQALRWQADRHARDWDELAGLTEVSVTTLTKFFDPAERDYKPRLGLADMITLLECVEEHCGSPNSCVVVQSPALFSEIEGYESYADIRQRTTEFCQACEPEKALPILFAMTSQARGVTLPFRALCCRNVAVAFLVQLDLGDSGSISDSLLDRSVTSLRQLQGQASRYSKHSVDHTALRDTQSYAGYSLFICGLRRADAALRDEGLKLMHKSIIDAGDSNPEDGLWCNLLSALEYLVTQNRPDAERWYQFLEADAKEHGGEAFTIAIRERTHISAEKAWPWTGALLESSVV